MKKVYVDKNNEAFVICPSCGFEKNVEAKSFRNTKNKVTGKCKCIEGFDFILEYRKHHRKEVRLPGEYINPKTGEKGDVIIRQLSLAGIRFESLGPHKISTDDMLEIKFRLDDPQRSEIRKSVKVVWVRDRLAGASFSKTNLYEKKLGFYLKK